MNRERLWTKDFVTVFLINFFVYLIHFLLIVTIASYAIDQFHASTSVAGLVAGIFIIGVTVGRLETGRVIEEIGSRRILVVGAISTIITAALYFGAINLPLLIINRFLHGVAFGLASTAAGTIVAKIIPKHRQGEGIGYFSMSVILATALGPFVGILVIQHEGYDIIFVVNSALAALCLGISLIVNEPAVKSSIQRQENAIKGFNISNVIEFRAVPISMVGLIIGFIFSGILTFVSLYSKEIRLVEASSFFFIVYAVVILVSRPFSGRLLDLKGANAVIYPCLFIFAAGVLLLSQAGQGVTLLLAGAVIGLGYGNFLSCAQAVCIKAVPPHRLGLATATFFVFLDVGVGAGSYLLGFLIPFTGYRGLYLVMAVVALAAIVVYHLVHGRRATFEGVQTTNS
ncbi:MAG: MFS transporter [Deltaproteobacteria bacterium]|nr:MFS transporter [Deltaproteobacteria bacterium]